jgi:hypothetical protein
LTDRRHLLRLQQLLLGTGQAHQGLAQLRMAPLEFLLARMRFADVVKQHQAVTAGRVLVQIDAHLQDSTVVEGQIAIPTAGLPCYQARLRGNQIHQGLQRFVGVRHQRARGGIGVQRTPHALAQQHAIVHQFAERPYVRKRGAVRGMLAGRGKRKGDAHDCACGLTLLPRRQYPQPLRARQATASRF